MEEITISVMEASRNFADCINRAHYQDTSFVLLKNGKSFARVEPAGEKRCTGRQLAETLAGAELSPAEASDWSGELRVARQAVEPPADKWQ